MGERDTVKAVGGCASAVRSIAAIVVVVLILAVAVGLPRASALSSAAEFSVAECPATNHPNWVAGTVYGDSQNGQPLGGIAGASVTAVRDDGRSQSTVSGADGSYSLALEPGHYHVTVSAPGYGSATGSAYLYGKWDCGLDFYLHGGGSTTVSGNTTTTTSTTQATASTTQTSTTQTSTTQTSTTPTGTQPAGQPPTQTATLALLIGSLGAALVLVSVVVQLRRWHKTVFVALFPVGVALLLVCAALLLTHAGGG